MTINKVMAVSGTATLLQAGGQLVFTSLGIAQYFCVIDFLRGLPLLLYIKILYFHNPSFCGSRINIGETIDGIANQAFVLLTEETFTTFRTFVINCTGLGLSILWIITSAMIMTGGGMNKQSKCLRWPWIFTTVAVCGLDLVAAVTYANDSFHTRTLSAMMDFIGGTVSGIGNAQLETAWTSWIMVLLYSRFVGLFVLNILLVVLVIVNCKTRKETETDFVNVEAPVPVQIIPPAPAAPIQVSTAVQASPPQPPPPPPPPPPIINTEDVSERDEELASLPSENRITTRIPRAGLSRSFRRMKAFLFRKSPSPEVHRSNPDSLQASPDRSPCAQYVDVESEKKRTVNFPESLLSLPQRLETIIAEQQRRLDRAVIDTSGRASPPRASQSMPHLDATLNHHDARGRRGTTAELQGQLPWAYIPASSHRMRDQLPPDEDLPPVPLPDYTAFQSVRKASVHRAASSLSSLAQQKKDNRTSRSVPSALNQADVLY